MKKQIDTNKTPVTALPDEPAGSLSEEAKHLLKEASKDSNGLIIKMYYRGRRIILTNKKEFGEVQTHLNAKWQYALDQLVSNGYATPESTRGEVFEVSHKGYRLADSLPDYE